MYNIPDKLTNFMVFKEGRRLPVVVDVELPSLEYMTDTLSGAGLMGETDTPAVGQIASLTTKVTFRSINGDLGDFTAPKGSMLNYRASIQCVNPSTGAFEHVPVSLTMMTIPKKTELGKFEVGNKTDTSLELEVLYLKMYVDNNLTYEIDKLNFICNINGVDYLKQVRENIGL